MLKDKINLLRSRGDLPKGKGTELDHLFALQRIKESMKEHLKNEKVVFTTHAQSWEEIKEADIKLSHNFY